MYTTCLSIESYLFIGVWVNIKMNTTYKRHSLVGTVERTKGAKHATDKMAKGIECRVLAPLKLAHFSSCCRGSTRCKQTRQKGSKRYDRIKSIIRFSFSAFIAALHFVHFHIRPLSLHSILYAQRMSATPRVIYSFFMASLMAAFTTACWSAFCSFHGISCTK